MNHKPHEEDELEARRKFIANFNLHHPVSQSEATGMWRYGKMCGYHSQRMALTMRSAAALKAYEHHFQHKHQTSNH
jgi:hypothetical protein